MKMCKFTRTNHDKSSIYINADKVVAVYPCAYGDPKVPPLKQGTLIFCGDGADWVVAESVDTVLATLKEKNHD